MAIKVLLVDDEPAITANLSSYLQRAGYDTAVAADGVEAVDQVSGFKPDLIVLDILMPRMDGREVLRRLRRMGNWTPVILLTQVGEAAERAMALEEGADDYLNKPFDPTELVARMRAVLRRVQPGRPPLSSRGGVEEGRPRGRGHAGVPLGGRRTQLHVAELPGAGGIPRQRHRPAGHPPQRGQSLRGTGHGRERLEVGGGLVRGRPLQRLGDPEPRGPGQRHEVLRGGSWREDGTWARLARRVYDRPDQSYDRLGFRCVRGVEP
jgi:CheY-like chemotaxis protein